MESINQSIIQSINQSFNSINSINQSINQSFSISLSVTGLVSHSMSSGSIHVATCCRMSFFFKIRSCSSVCRNNRSFIHLSFDGRLGCFHILAIVNIAAMNICHCSVAQLCLSLCNPMDCGTPGFPILHHLLELAQTHTHWIGHAIQPSCPLLSPSPSTFSLSQHQGLF